MMKTISKVLFFLYLMILSTTIHCACALPVTLEESETSIRFRAAVYANEEHSIIETLRETFYSQELPFNLNFVSLHSWHKAYLRQIETYKLASDHSKDFENRRIALSLRILEKFLPPQEKLNISKGYLSNSNFIFDAFDSLWEQSISDIDWPGRDHPLIRDFIFHIAIPRLAETHLPAAVAMAYEFDDGRQDILFKEFCRTCQSHTTPKQHILEIAQELRFSICEKKASI